MSTHAIPLHVVAGPEPGRREFLKGAGVIVGTLWAGSGALIALAPSRVWALEMKALDEHAGRDLLAFTRQIFPHDTLDDAVYALVVKDLDAEAAGNAGVKTLLGEGVAELDKAAGGDFAAAAKDKQAQITAAMTRHPVFEKVRGKAVVSLYNNELAFAHFGYEGNAFARGGGYLLRGFNDLTWLPAPSAQASPAAFTG
ncbi:MAG TPA: twin-arginine translocation signal domain-containing protein [Casimicrobiaceae bacterium]